MRTRTHPMTPIAAVAAHAMTRVELTGHPLTATAAVVWNGSLPRPLQQILFEAAENIISSAPGQPAGLAR